VHGHHRLTPRLTTRALGTFAGLVILALASGLAQPPSANAATAAGWWSYQLDNDRCYDAARWWDGARWLGYYWLDTNNDCSYGETYVVDNDRNGTGDLFYLRRGNSGGWATLVDVPSGKIYQGEGESGRYGEQWPAYGTWWKSEGYYQATVGPPSNPSGAYNLALQFARQGFVYY